MGAHVVFKRQAPSRHRDGDIAIWTKRSYPSSSSW